MENPFADMTQKKVARLAGLFYLAFIAASVLADRFGQIGLGDASAIVDGMTASDWYFRIGLMFGLFSALLFLLAAWALYILLKPVNRDLALLFLLLNLVGVAIQCLSYVNLFAARQLLSGADYLNAFQADQLRAQAVSLVYLYKDSFMIAQIFYGTWVFPLGYLVYKSGFLPRWLGALLMIDCIAILVWFFQYFLLPGHEALSYPCWAISFIAEFSLGLWLLIKGPRNPIKASLR